MTNDEVYEWMEQGTMARQQPEAFPPRPGTISLFYLEHRAVGVKEAWQAFVFRQTYWYSDGVALQVWECAGDLYCSRVGRSEPLVPFGQDFDMPLHHSMLFTPHTAEEHYADMCERQFERYVFKDELDWERHIAGVADAIVKLRDQNYERSYRHMRDGDLS